MTFPLNLPFTWYDIWQYTYLQKDGHKNRMLIRRCLYEGNLELFKPSDVAADQLHHKYFNYVGHPSTGSIPSVDQFKHMIHYMPHQSFIDMGIIDPIVARLN